MSTPIVRDTKCEGCSVLFKGERGLNLHLASSTFCPKSAKYDAETAKEKDTKCEHCQVPFRGQRGLEIHLRRSDTCPGALALKKEGKSEEKKERKPRNAKKEKKDDAKEKKAEEKKEKKGHKKDTKKENKDGDKKEKKADTPCPDCGRMFVGEAGLKNHKTRSNCGKGVAEKEAPKKKTEDTADKRKKKPTKKLEPIPESEAVVCEGCNSKFTAQSLLSHQSNSNICPKSSKYSKEAAEEKQKVIAARKEARAARRAERATLRDTECTHCQTKHMGENGLAKHLAMSTTCPASAKYIKPSSSE